MRLPREPYKAGENGALAVAENLERADGFQIREIQYDVAQLRSRYEALVLAQ